MSVASRLRAHQRQQEFLEKQYGPFLDPSQVPVPLEEQDLELARLMGWFCQNQKDIADTLDVEKVIVTDDGGGKILYAPKKRPSQPPTQAQVMMASLLALVGSRGIR